MKKILFTTSHPAPYIDKIYLKLVNNYQVSIIYHHKKSKDKAWTNLRSIEGLYFEDLSFYKFFQIVRKNDLAILGGWNDKYLILAILLSPFIKTKIAVFSDHPLDNSLSGFFYYVKKFVLFKLVNYIFGATKSTCEFYKNKYNISCKKLKLFPYAFDDQYSDENEKINSDRIKLLREGDKINIFIANRFIERKGYNILEEALSKLKEKNRIDNYRFFIAGNGVLFEETRKRMLKLSTNIKFLGWIENEQYQYYMNRCDIYIHASIMEPFGIPPLDALCRKKLLIASDGVKSVNSMIKNGVNGYIYKANESEELFNILVQIKVDDIYIIGENGRKILLENYNDNIYYNSIDSSLNC